MAPASGPGRSKNSGTLCLVREPPPALEPGSRPSGRAPDLPLTGVAHHRVESRGGSQTHRASGCPDVASTEARPDEGARRGARRWAGTSSKAPRARSKRALYSGGEREDTQARGLAQSPVEVPSSVEVPSNAAQDYILSQVKQVLNSAGDGQAYSERAVTNRCQKFSAQSPRTVRIAVALARSRFHRRFDEAYYHRFYESRKRGSSPR